MREIDGKMRVVWAIVLVGGLCGVIVNRVGANRLREKYVWKQLKFAWPSLADEQNAIATGRYIPENNMPLSMELWGDKVFITVPRWKQGIAASLTYFQLPTNERAPVLHPYPNWESHDLARNFPYPLVKKREVSKKCPRDINYFFPRFDDPTQFSADLSLGFPVQFPTPFSTPIPQFSTPLPPFSSALPSEFPTVLPSQFPREFSAPLSKEPSTQLSTALVSPYRVKPDECDRLWVFDSGLDAIITAQRRDILYPTLVLFDLNTSQVLHRYTYPSEFVLKTSSFPYLSVDITDNECGNAYVYMPDVTGFGLVVYSLKEDRAWRISHNYFHFDPLEGNIFTGGINYQIPDGIFAIAIGNKKEDSSRDVYFHALSSTKEFVVSNKVLQNETRALDKASYYDFKYLGDRGFNGQSTTQIFDPNTEIMFYSQINKDAVGCWNSRKPYTPDMQGLVDSDSSRLNFVNAFFIDKAENLWVLSNKLGNIIYGDGVNATDDNFRILGGRISELIIGTPCDFVDDSFYYDTTEAMVV